VGWLARWEEANWKKPYLANIHPNWCVNNCWFIGVFLGVGLCHCARWGAYEEFGQAQISKKVAKWAQWPMPKSTSLCLHHERWMISGQKTIFCWSLVPYLTMVVSSVPFFSTYLLTTWVWLTQLRFIHNWVIMGIQWMAGCSSILWLPVCGTLDYSNNFDLYNIHVDFMQWSCRFTWIIIWILQNGHVGSHNVIWIWQNAHVDLAGWSCRFT